MRFYTQVLGFIKKTEIPLGPARWLRTEQMLENMFLGRPPGNYGRLLDFSRAVSGGLYFVPSLDLLASRVAS